jgi:transposase
VLRHMRSKPELHLLKTVPGIGDILALTILLETGPMARFPSAGDFASYCRCVKSQRLSNGKVKGQGNTKTAITISAGLLSRPHTSRFALTQGSNASTNVSR